MVRIALSRPYRFIVAAMLMMAGRIITPFERAPTTTVDDIQHIEANSYTTFGIVKIFLHSTVNIATANAQVTAISQSAQADADRRDAAADRQLQRLDGADHPACTLRQGPDRTESRRSRHASIPINQRLGRASTSSPAHVTVLAQAGNCGS